ncbi:MAG: adenylosuccinate lyase, partial [Actinomycetales bacterium]|nr:adenylosuccinate lyase [Actinomycetales bacterium]
ELNRYLPFLATTKVLMAAVRAGVGRETAHEVIKEHAVQVALEMRGETGGDGTALITKLAADSRLGLSEADLAELIAKPLEFTGAADAQISKIVSLVNQVVATEPGANTYRPEPIL